MSNAIVSPILIFINPYYYYQLTQRNSLKKLVVEGKPITISQKEADEYL